MNVSIEDYRFKEEMREAMKDYGRIVYYNLSYGEVLKIKYAII